MYQRELNPGYNNYSLGFLFKIGQSLDLDFNSLEEYPCTAECRGIVKGYTSSVFLQLLPVFFCRGAAGPHYCSTTCYEREQNVCKENLNC